MDPGRLLEGSAIVDARSEVPDAVRLTLALPRWCGRAAGMRERVDVRVQGLADPEALLRFVAGAACAARGPGVASPVQIDELRVSGSPRVVLRAAGGRVLAIACSSVEIDVAD